MTVNKIVRTIAVAIIPTTPAIATAAAAPATTIITIVHQIQVIVLMTSKSTRSV
jgi:hypothetical protein